MKRADCCSVCMLQLKKKKRFFSAESLNVKFAILILLNKISLAPRKVWKQVKKRVKYGEVFPVKRNAVKKI